MRRTNLIKKQGPAHGKDSLENLYANPISSTRSGSLFNAFSYPTKISPEAIAVFIATHTQPGALVLDTFGGSGTTGLAALLCDRPTERMRRIAESLHLSPKWGPRRATIYEIGTLGAFIAKSMCNPVSPRSFESVARGMLNRVESQVADLYTAIDPKGNKGVIRHIIWSDVLTCPHCRKENTYWEAVVNHQPLKIREQFICTHCGTASPTDFAKRVTEKHRDVLLNQVVTRKKRVPIFVHGQTGTWKWKRLVNAEDKRRIARIAKQRVPSGSPIQQIAWGDLYRAGYHLGISHLHHFYTARNFLVMSLLWKEIEQERVEYRDALRLWVLSYNSTHSTLMTRVVLKQGQKDFVLTGAQSGVLYVSSLPVEKNIFLGLSRKIKTLSEAFAAVYGSRSQVDVQQASSVSLKLPNESVDYVFTDPPFGDYIPYAEINQINEIWLGRTTDRSQEIIVSHSQGRSVEQYGGLMRQVLGEISRTLKKKGKATLVFHSSKAEVWQALTEAYELAGFGVKATSVLDKIQESFKQVVSTVSVKGDPLLLLEKRNIKARKKNEDAERDSIINAILRKSWPEAADIKELTPERMYSRFVTRCLEKGISVAIDADAFYKMIPKKIYAESKK